MTLLTELANSRAFFTQSLKPELQWLTQRKRKKLIRMDLFRRVRQIPSVKTAVKTLKVRFNARGQVVIPAALRRQFGITGRTRAVVNATAEGILIQPVPFLIRRYCGLFKRRPGDKPFAQWWAEHKREEKELEEARYARCTGSRRSLSPATRSSKRLK